MKRTSLPVALALPLVLPVAALLARGADDGVPSAPLSVAGGWPDSARDELRAGRPWHAERILRRNGADTASDPTLLLLLAQAEGGWGNWAEAARLLGASPRAGAAPNELFLQARAQEEAGTREGALQGYDAYLRAARRDDPRRAVALVRRARVAEQAGRHREAVEALASLPVPPHAALASWGAVELVGRRADAGDTATVMRLLALVRDGGARDAAWRLLPRARLAAGDTLGAERAWVAARPGGDERRWGEAAAEAGRLALVRGDSVEARRLLVEAVEVGRGAARARAAASLLSFRDTDLALTLHMAAALDAVSDQGPALRAYDRSARLAQEAGGVLPDSARLARARLMSLVRPRRDEALEEFRALHEATRDPEVGAENLEQWARLRQRQGRPADVRTLREWLVEEYPSSSQAAEVMWTQAQEAEERGDLGGALAGYAALAERAPEHARAGQARMRTGHILLGRGRKEEAARTWEIYLEAFPRGRRWQEATFWAARTRRELGDEAGARRLLAGLRAGDPASYYGVLGAELLGEPFTLDVPEGSDEAPPWLGEGMATLALLRDAGLEEGAEVEIGRLTARARAAPEWMLALAMALGEGGWPVAGINLGWELQEAGAAWDRRLLRAVFPYPHREIIQREAAEWSLDPVVLASLIRQESAFEPTIRSSAGAVGLMQVLPSTGRGLARRLGPAGFREHHLELPEVNLHLGSAFFVDMSRRYRGDLVLTLSAYNAGPARADRWRRRFEAGDAARFVEHIPFDETRGYVKNVRRNQAVYRALYGGGGPAAR